MLLREGSQNDFQIYEKVSACVRRLVGELLRLTHPVRTQYQPSLGAWHDARGAEVVSMRAFRTLGEALDVPGLTAMGALLAARTAQMLRAAVRYIEDELEAGKGLELCCCTSAQRTFSNISKCACRHRFRPSRCAVCDCGF